jgi:hypothetical protein
MKPLQKTGGLKYTKKSENLEKSESSIQYDRKRRDLTFLLHKQKKHLFKKVDSMFSTGECSTFLIGE